MTPHSYRGAASLESLAQPGYLQRNGKESLTKMSAWASEMEGEDVPPEASERPLAPEPAEPAVPAERPKLKLLPKGSSSAVRVRGFPVQHLAI